MANSKLMVIGLDAMHPELLLRWCDSGELPTFARLRDQGAWGRLTTPPGLADDAVWSSFCTGNEPRRHGRYHNHYFDPESYRDVMVRNRRLVGKPFWQVLSEGGRRVCVVDVPKCPLISGLNGMQLSDWRVHGRDGPTRSYPEDIAARVLDKYGDDDNDRAAPGKYLCSHQHLDDGVSDELHRRLIAGLEKKTALLLESLTQDSWDLFLAVFKESHCAGHQFWRQQLHSRFQYANESDDLSEHSDKLKSVYQALDQAVDALLRRADPGADVLVFSDLGMGDNFTGNHLLDTLLLRLDDNPLCRILGAAADTQLTGFAKSRRRRAVQRRLRKWRSAFALPHNEISGAVRINVRGREAQGRIAPGEPYSQLCDRLASEMMRLRDVATGKPIVDQVLRPGSCDPRCRKSDLPDLLVVWNRDTPIAGAQSPEVGVVRGRNPGLRLGNHVSDGIFFCAGPMAATGGMLPSRSITALAPTICRALDVQLDGVDGTPITFA